MEVLYWASIISITILTTFVVRYLLHRKTKGKIERLVSIAPKASIAGWVVWTLVMLSGPLLIFQLGLIAVVGIAGFVLFWYVTTRDRKVDYLEAALRDASELKNANFNEAKSGKMRRELLKLMRSLRSTLSMVSNLKLSWIARLPLQKIASS